jgi:hypothetical protein
MADGGDMKLVVRFSTDDARLWAVGVAREYGLAREGTDKLVASLNLERLLEMLVANPEDARRYVGVTCAMLRKDFGTEQPSIPSQVVTVPGQGFASIYPPPGTSGPTLSVSNSNPQAIRVEMRWK